MKLKGGHWVVVTQKSKYRAIPGKVLIGEIKDEPHPVGNREQLNVIVKTSDSLLKDEIATVRYKPQTERIDLHRLEGWKHNNFWLTWIDNGYVFGETGLIDTAMKYRMESMETQIAALEKTKDELSAILHEEGVMESVERQLSKLETTTRYLKNISHNLSPMEEFQKIASMRKILEPSKTAKKDRVM